MEGKRKAVVEVCKKCKQCQLSKLCKLGKLPPKEPEVIPWETVCINLIGPYTIGKGKKETHLHYLTVINPATGWCKISKVEDKSSAEIANLFEMLWINPYPWPQQVVMDCGRKFMGSSNCYD
jgi:enoyl reductase-like protein